MQLAKEGEQVRIYRGHSHFPPNFRAAHMNILYTPHTCWYRPPVNGEYQHWLQPVALTGLTNSKSAPCW
jgi:hypothetical protein